MEVELTWMELRNRAVEGQLLFKDLRGISRAWQSGQKTCTGHVSKLCVKTLFISLKTLIPNFVGFFVSLGIVRSCIRKMSFSFTSAKPEFTPAIVSLSTSREVALFISQRQRTNQIA